MTLIVAFYRKKASIFCRNYIFSRQKYVQSFKIDMLIASSFCTAIFTAKKCPSYSPLWDYGLSSFQRRDTKLERFLSKNQHNQRKLLNFENWTNGEHQQLAKIRVFKADYFDFSRKKLNNQCESDVRIIACNVQVFGIFSYIWVFFPLILFH